MPGFGGAQALWRRAGTHPDSLGGVRRLPRIPCPCPCPFLHRDGSSSSAPRTCGGRAEAEAACQAAWRLTWLHCQAADAAACCCLLLGRGQTSCHPPLPPCPSCGCRGGQRQIPLLHTHHAGQHLNQLIQGGLTALLPPLKAQTVGSLRRSPEVHQGLCSEGLLLVSVPGPLLWWMPIRLCRPGQAKTARCARAPTQAGAPRLSKALNLQDDVCDLCRCKRPTIALRLRDRCA